MPTPSIIASKTDVALRSSPINPAWIVEGAPAARNAELSRSADGTASTLVWDCTAGRFEWFYDFDETLYFLEGEAVIESDTMAPTRFGPGDVLFLPNGSHARWHVPGYVRKLAFCRRTLPAPVGFALRALAYGKKLVFGQAAGGSMTAAAAVSAQPETV